MAIASLALGIISLLGICLALIPLLNLLNLIFLPLALVGTILGLVEIIRNKPEGQGRTMAILGLILCLLGLSVGSFRFFTSLLLTSGIV